MFSSLSPPLSYTTALVSRDTFVLDLRSSFWYFLCHRWDFILYSWLIHCFGFTGIVRNLKRFTLMQLCLNICLYFCLLSLTISVCLSVCRSVGRSVRPSVRNTLLFFVFLGRLELFWVIFLLFLGIIGCF